MKVVLLCVAYIITLPVQQARRLNENSSSSIRYIYVEKENHELELVDLLAEGPVVTASLSDVQYDLYTPSQKQTPTTIYNGDISQVQAAGFDPSQPTIFVCHGWNNNRGSSVNTVLHDAITKAKSLNLFIVDWSGPADEIYLSAKGSVNAIGVIVGQFINSIQSTYGLDGSSFTLIGHSLGAHVMGSAGATAAQKIGHIIGLDPAGPLFSNDKPNERLDTSDANMVEIIHTCGSILGYADPIGHVDYYPNGGMSQPGCGLDLAGTCAHGRSYHYLAEAILRGPVFIGTLCDNYGMYQDGKCVGRDTSTMGTLAVTAKTPGEYYLNTNSDPPYGRS